MANEETNVMADKETINEMANKETINEMANKVNLTKKNKMNCVPQLSNQETLALKCQQMPNQRLENPVARKCQKLMSRKPWLSNAKSMSCEYHGL